MGAASPHLSIPLGNRVGSRNEEAGSDVLSSCAMNENDRAAIRAVQRALVLTLGEYEHDIPAHVDRSASFSISRVKEPRVVEGGKCRWDGGARK